MGEEKRKDDVEKNEIEKNEIEKDVKKINYTELLLYTISIILAIFLFIKMFDLNL